MKRISIAIIALVATIASAATLNPIQLLNPAGSTTGQAIVSTGSTTPPAWANVTAGSLTPVSGNTVIANTTGFTASPTAFAMPSCSASGNNLQYTSGAGFSCATGYAQLASPTFTGTVITSALTATGAITPSQTAGIVGTTANNNASAGSVGEYVTATGTSVSLASATPTNITSISLTAGDWDVWGNVQFAPGSGASFTAIVAGINTTSSMMPSVPLSSVINAAFNSQTGQAMPAPMQRILVSSTTTVYLVAQGTFSGGTTSANGILQARRRR